MTRSITAVACLALTLAFAMPASAAAEIGQAAPQFTLTDVSTGEQHSLADFKDKIVVLTFHSINCPWYKMSEGGGYDRVLNPLAAEWADENVVILGINSNKNESTEQIASYLAEHNINYPVLKDPGAEIADAYGAQTTPHFFVIDNNDEQTLLYKGGFEQVPGSPSQCGDMDEAYLVPVINAALAGETLPQTETKSKGCSIKR